ncbi:Retrovirus-related Pol polyprotein from transposon RE2 [Vitis vinifera]|uniref:Retrovirus-related Pol polyprotein from transposon RE2 n=1 Tax=Vitis vinifera TaxID=29760 RepID=A0A438EBN9_VITVI|nr:Retrovirus-related Pol polyprotein from transposon RE2 [Vitis vinifera]
MGQGYEDHLVTPEDAIPDVDKVQWKKIDAQLCSVLWQSVDPKIFHHLYLESVRDQILTSPSVPSLDDVFAHLLCLSSTQTLSIDGLSDSSVLASQTNSRGGRSGNRGRGQRPQCTYCNKLGHTRDRCYQLHGRPPRTAHIAQSSNPLLSRPNSAASSTSQSINLTDSGASDHISGNKHLFSSITTTSILPTVTLANGSQTMAKGIGLAHPLPSLLLHSVLYAPECPFHLISISKITRTFNYSITFSDKSVILQDWSTGKTIGIGRESQGLYYLTSPSSPVACISTDAPLLIHSRLGHPSLSKFQKMVPRFSTLSSLACESCQLGKHTRVSFPKRLNNRAKSPFELVHTDVWGSCRTASTLGFQYFVTFIDDYSRRTCDNARKYFSTPFTSFMSQHGILHQSSCAHTPQQNGVAERKNRHLVETVRTIFLHSHVPFRFWGDAVLIVCYLINRMPSSILHDQIPHSLIFPTQPLYFLPPCVFGCTCFVHTLTPGQDKLSARLRNASSWDTLDFRRAIVVIPLILIVIFSPLMSPSLRTLHSSHPLNLFPFLKYCHFPIYPPLQMRSLVLFRFIIVDIVLLLFLYLQLRYLMTHLLSH